VFVSTCIGGEKTQEGSKQQWLTVTAAMSVPRDKYKGEPAGGSPDDVAEHFIQCPACGGWIDMRDLGQVFAHEGPLPHPSGEPPQ
jgi:hypothetical protein